MSAKKSENGHDPNEIVELNVGGVIHTTLWSTLQKSERYKEKLAYTYDPDYDDPSITTTGYVEGFIETFLTGEKAVRDSRGRYFIDANGRRFGHILDYLRGLTYLSDNVSFLRGIAAEAERLEMPGLRFKIYSEIEDIRERRRGERKQEYLIRKTFDDPPPRKEDSDDEYRYSRWDD